MNSERARVVAMAAQREHPAYRPVLEALVNLDGGEWYLREKIAQAPDEDSLRANGRVLKYAYQFTLGGADVAFVREGASKTPDLSVRVDGTQIFVEVKRFRLTGVPNAKYPASKLVESVTAKRSQLPTTDIGFVAVDNFDLGLESHPQAGFTHDHLFDAISEMERAAAANPTGWQSPSGVIVAAHTSGGGTFSGTPRIPHFIWLNPRSANPVPLGLAHWLAHTLRDGELIDRGYLEDANNSSQPIKAARTITEVQAS